MGFRGVFFRELSPYLYFYSVAVDQAEISLQDRFQVCDWARIMTNSWDVLWRHVQYIKREYLFIIVKL